MKYWNFFLILLAKLNQLCIGISPIELSSDLQFELKLVDVDAYKAVFEIVDDNMTTINYEIEYELISKYKSLNKLPLSELTISTKSFEMQTNPIYLVNKQDQLTMNRPSNKSDVTLNINNDENVNNLQSNNSGEQYSSDEIIELNSKSYEDIHRFYINDLESNKIYQVNFKLIATLAHLKGDVLSAIRQTKKYFRFEFQSMYLSTVNCENTYKNEEENCYEKNSNCTKCKSSCYETKYAYIHNTNDNNKIGNNQIKQCLGCPCDTLRSTGECHEINRVDKFYDPRQIVCKECKYPYTGNQCRECHNDGIDFYKNEIDECVKCECEYDSMNDEYVNGTLIRPRRCEEITGFCLTHSELKQNSNSTKINSIKSTKSHNISINYLNEKYSYKKLAFFTLYIFFALFVVLIGYVCIKLKYHHETPFKDNFLVVFYNKNVSSKLNSLSKQIQHYRSRCATYIYTICPNISKNSTATTNNFSTSGGIYTRADFNIDIDDDRLNLAEYQVYDEAITNQYLYQYENNNGNNNNNNNENNDLEMTSKNPYRSLTMKT